MFVPMRADDVPRVSAFPKFTQLSDEANKLVPNFKDVQEIIWLRE